MTDSSDFRRGELPPLEPWAIAQLEQDDTADAATREELARVVALLRALPEPEPPADLGERIVGRVTAERARPRVLHVAFGAARRLAGPAAGLALAAGVAGLWVLAAAPGGLLPQAPQAPAPTLQVADAAGFGSRRPTPARRPSAIVAQPQFVSMGAPGPRHERPVLVLGRPAPEPVFERRLDHQLNQLMLDPTAFAERLERVAQRDRFVARLAQRAAERGDAPEIALRVRESSHPLARQLVDRLLRATLVARAPRH